MLARLLTLFALIALTSHAWSVIRYSIAPNIADSRYDITITVQDPCPTEVFQIPRWEPGAYILRQSYSRISDVSAENEAGMVLAVEHPGDLTWRVICPKSRTVTLRYRIRASLSTRHAHVSGPLVFMYVVNRMEEPVHLKLIPPEGWQAISSLDPLPNATYAAQNYDEFSDAPVHFAPSIDKTEFFVKGVPHWIVLYGSPDGIDRKRLTDICSSVVETATDITDSVPYKRYVFYFNATDSFGGGGLEHLNSTQISLPKRSGNYGAGLISHEFVHLWNVKRIRPSVLGPFDYTQPARTRNLWWAEGVTEYLGNLVLVRSGLSTPEIFLNDLLNTKERVESNPARLEVTADDSSYKVWDAAGGMGNSTGFRISYYDKGELIGACLDLKIRQLTNNVCNLETVMKGLDLQCLRGVGPGFHEDAIRELCIRAGGPEMAGFYDRCARSVEELPLEETLAYAGYRPGATETKSVRTGMLLVADPLRGGLRLSVVNDDGPAAAAGLKEDDALLAVDGKPFLPEGEKPYDEAVTILEAALERLKPTLKAGVKYWLTIEREGKKVKIPYTPTTRITSRPTIVSLPNLTHLQKQIRAGWLSRRSQLLKYPSDHRNEAGMR